MGERLVRTCIFGVRRPNRNEPEIDALVVRPLRGAGVN
jgi:hypothetical protein